MRLQFVLVSSGDVIIASAPAPLCDGQNHQILVTVAGNQTVLLIDGKAGRSEDTGLSIDPSESTTFIGGLPGEAAEINPADQLVLVCVGDVCMLL